MQRIYFIFYFALISFLSNCGYTTKVSTIYKQDKIFIIPVKNQIDITSEDRRYSNYKVLPIFLEKKLTNAIVSRFNTDGYFKVVNDKEDTLQLETSILDYKKEALRYTDSDDIKEQRLRLTVRVKLIDAKGKILKEKNVVGDTSFFLIGPQKKSESAAQEELIQDVARRISEVVAEEW
ncbi:MAG: LPS assembly lipoprotein LptE [Candidatus Omnitrophica bacterium]|nr:LPS assembly lipoprotein LptE [Candidatus Omnitrophota bacterium]